MQSAYRPQPDVPCARPPWGLDSNESSLIQEPCQYAVGIHLCISRGIHRQQACQLNPRGASSVPGLNSIYVYAGAGGPATVHRVQPGCREAG